MSSPKHTPMNIRPAISRVAVLAMALVGVGCGAPGHDTPATEIWHCTITTDPMGHKGVAFAFDREARLAQPLDAGFPSGYSLALPRHAAEGDAVLNAWSHTGPYIPGVLACHDGCWVTVSDPVGTSRWRFFVPGPRSLDDDGNATRAMLTYEQLSTGYRVHEYGFCTQHIAAHELVAR
jgi:hypothetical protein